MNFIPYAHLAWKEYRAMRAFWLSIVVLVVLVEWLVSALYNTPFSVVLLYSFGLAAPAFFAIGATGAAFAVEQEEGTFDFLRAAPVTAGQVLASKLGVTVAATLAMFIVLWPATLMFAHPRSPAALGGMLGLWLMAALEAIAWGTLFSLLTARPLVAISLALAAASTVAHLLAWSVATSHLYEFEFAPYLAAVPLRAAAVALVLAADIYLGLQWLDGTVGERAKLPFRRRSKTLVQRAPAERAVDKKLLARPDRGAMIGHLLWQQWRQSGWLMALMAGLHIALAMLVIFSGLRDSQQEVVIPLALVAGLMGSCVFLPDQERHRYRYFVEHNIPPRYVWFSRQLLWIITLSISTLVICLIWVPFDSLKNLGKAVDLAVNWQRNWQLYSNYSYGHISDFMPLIELPPLVLGLVGLILPYCAGQWMSMFVRSGLMAGFFGLLLSAILCGWVGLMYGMQVSFWWSVAPIPLVLLWATWLRAPDWVRENARWPARGRAAAAVLIPALALVIAVPFYRARQVPLIPPPPDFEPAEYPAVTSEAAATAEMYRQASDLYVEIGSADFGARVPTPAESKWFEENAKPLTLVLAASRRPTCSFGDPRTLDQKPELRNERGLFALVLASGRQLENDGKFDEALDRYFAVLPVVSHLSNEVLPVSYSAPLEAVYQFFRELADWAAQKGQTPEQIRAAVQRLQATDGGILRLDECLKGDYILARRAAFGDVGAWLALSGQVKEDSQVMSRLLWGKLMPWEKHRALRMLNMVADTAMERLRTMRASFNSDLGVGVVAYVAPNSYDNWNPIRDFDAEYRSFPYRDSSWEERAAFEKFEWLTTTYNVWPSLGAAGRGAASVLAEFEARRRAAMLLLALEAHRLEHGTLPASLTALAGAYFARVPLDPYCGEEFRYFAAGLPEPASPLEAAQLDQTNLWPRMAMVIPGKPCIWCTGPRLRADTWMESKPGDEDQTPQKAKQAVYYVSREQWPPEPLLPYSAWRQGLWFPIPDERK